MPSRGAPFSTLFTALDAGAGLRLLAGSGAAGRGAHAGARTVLWNVRARRDRDR